MKHAVFVLIHVVVTGASPVAIAVDQSDVDGKEPQHTIQIQHGAEHLLYVLGCCFIQKPAQADQVVPRLFPVL